MHFLHLNQHIHITQAIKTKTMLNRHHDRPQLKTARQFSCQISQYVNTIFKMSSAITIKNNAQFI